MIRFRLLISYNGHGYYGWQKQNNLPTIQGAIEKTLHNIFKQSICVVGAGRTDAGVHALRQVAHFDITGDGPKSLSLQKALNSLLPANICIQGVWQVPMDFHALRSCLRKSYIYRILNRPFPNVFQRGQVYWYPYPVDMFLLQKMSSIIQGKHDFKSFQSAGTPVKSTIRTVHTARWIPHKNHSLLFHIQGNGFLKQMIRNLVGTQLALMKKYQQSCVDKKPPATSASLSRKRDLAIQELQNIFLAKNRQSALDTAPSEGLYLQKIFYDPELDKKCQKI